MYTFIKNPELKEFLEKIEDRIFDIVTDRAGTDEDEETWKEVEKEFLEKLKEVY